MERFLVRTEKYNEAVDITHKVQEAVHKSRVQAGYCLVYLPHATAGIVVNENADPNIGKDLNKALTAMIPEKNDWLHDRVDSNAAAHIKASIIGPSELIPIDNGKLVLGTWQDIFLTEFDGPRDRTVFVQVVGKAI